MTSERIERLIEDLTFDEMADLITGDGIWNSRPVERLNIPSLVVTDGPNGARGGGLMGTGTPTACIPAGAVLGATWDPELMRQLGELLGDEAQAKGSHVLLAPTINLHRNMLGGRNFECLSEDPILSGILAASLIQGVQSKGIATTAKHLAGNDSEFERNTIDVQIDERTLREVYLVPFEMAVKDGGAWGLMSAYNRLNGVFCSEHPWLLTQVLREEWGFDGFVVSDWFALRSTAASAKAGTSLEMPGPGKFYGEQLRAALDVGEIDEADVQRLAVDMLTVLERTGNLEDLSEPIADQPPKEEPLDRPEDRALIRRAAAAGTVLLRNDGILPLDPSSLSSIALIGPNARSAKVMGGGSATVRAYRQVSPLEAITDRLGDKVAIHFAPGADINRSVPALSQPMLDGPLDLEIFEGREFEGPPASQSVSNSARMVFFGEPAPGVSASAYSARLSGSFTPTVDGPHRFSMVQSGRARVLLDGQVIIDATEGEYERGDEFFGMGSIEIVAEVEMAAGTSHDIVFEYTNQDAVLLGGCRLGIVELVQRDLLGEAEALAADCDIAIVVVGTNDDWETEGRDRDQFALPGDQPELIRRVSAANPRTVVVVNTGGPHQLDWLDAPAAALSVGFAGQELGESLVDILLGDVDPGGRMNTTIPKRIEHAPSHLNYPGENSVVRYGEGLFVGHRFFDARFLEPEVPFGFGLSYATFDWGTPVVTGPAATDLEASVVVEIPVTNTSERAGSDVVQLYIEPPASVVHRPVRELKGFAKVHLGSGESTIARIELDRRAFAYYDIGDRFFDEVGSAGPVPTGDGVRNTEAGWYVEPGTYRLVLARSSADPAATLDHELSGEAFRFDA